MMKSQKIPYITIALSMLTIACSLYVNFLISGTLFGKITYFELEPYGGITFEHLWELELWRLFVSQLIHFKQSHMFFNVLSLFLLGLLLEKYLGGIRFFVLWFVSGACGTLVATLTVEPPWNLGTGASQAVMGIAAFGSLLIWKKLDTSLRLKIAMGFAILPAFIKDWLERFGHPVVLVETFVDPGRFSGPVQKASNCEYIGDTKGFSICKQATGRWSL